MRNMIIVLFVILTFLHLQAQAALFDLPVTETLSFSSVQVPFFKSPNSRFPSGSTSLENLEKNRIEQTFKSEVFYKYKNEIIAKSEIKPIFPTHISQSIVDPKTKKRWAVLDTTVDHVLGFDAATSQTRQFPLEDISSDPYDTGFALTLKDTFLKNQASEKASTLTTIPGGTRFAVLHFKSGFAQVSYKNYLGFIPVTELITKFDFATYIYAAKKWHLVKNRNFDFVVTTENKKFHFSEITGLVTPDHVGLIASKNQRLPMWCRVEMTFQNKASWTQSRLKEQGLIWWKPTESSSEKIYTIDDLLKKDIASVSFHPKNPLKAILSAHGVYSTEDGYHWKEMKAFKNFHGPVHYFNDIMIFIGNYRSLDQGKTFENYIQLDKLTSAIETQFGFLPKKLQVKKITTFPPYQISIEIETGTRKIKMQSPLFVQNWVAVRS